VSGEAPGSRASLAVAIQRAGTADPVIGPGCQVRPPARAADDEMVVPTRTRDSAREKSQALAARRVTEHVCCFVAGGELSHRLPLRRIVSPRQNSRVRGSRPATLRWLRETRSERLRSQCSIGRSESGRLREAAHVVGVSAPGLLAPRSPVSNAPYGTRENGSQIRGHESRSAPLRRTSATHLVRENADFGQAGRDAAKNTTLLVTGWFHRRRPAAFQIRPQRHPGQGLALPSATPTCAVAERSDLMGAR
jgi:hypothetical protein